MTSLVKSLIKNINTKSSTDSDMPDYKKDKTFEERHAEASKIIAKYKERIPIIVQRSVRTKLPVLDKNKYLVPHDLTMGQFMSVVRKRIKLDETVALFMYIGNVIPPTSAGIADIYNKYKDPDGFLYISYTGENTFGDEIYK